MTEKLEYSAADMASAAAGGWRDGQRAAAEAAQSAPAGEREAFDKWFRGEQLIADHIDTTFISEAFLPYKAFKAGAAWQRTQAAPMMPDEFEPDSVCEDADGCPTELAVLKRFWRESRARELSGPIRDAIKWADHLLFECGALTHTRAPSVHVYNKTFAAVEAAKAMLAAAPAQPAAQREWPDDEIVAAWKWCEENGGTPAEFLSHSMLVKRSRVLGRPLTWREAIELTAMTTNMPDERRDKLLAIDDEPDAAAHDQGEVQRLRGALEEVRSVIDAREMPSELALAALSNMIDAALAASTGQEVEK